MHITVLGVLTLVASVRHFFASVSQPLALLNLSAPWVELRPAALEEYSAVMARAHRAIQQSEDITLAVQRQLAAWGLNTTHIGSAMHQETKQEHTTVATVRRNLRSRATAETPALIKPRDICIGSAFGATNEAFAVFAASFRQHAPTAKLVVLMHGPLDDRAKEIAQKYTAQIVEVDSDTLEPEALRNYHYSTFRWPLINQFLEQYQYPLHRILVVDVRDSMFQANPFTTVIDPGVYATLEPSVIGRSGPESGWMRDCFGRHMLGRLWRYETVSVGATIGTNKAMRDYVKQMASIIAGGTGVGNFPRCEQSGADSAVHNFLAYTGQLKNLTLLRSADDLILNMNAGGTWYDVEGRVFNQYHVRPAILHHYTASDKLVEEVVRQFKYWSDSVEEDTKCKMYSVHPNTDGYFRRCDMRSVPATSHFDCCDYCDTTEGCTGWAFALGRCWLKDCKEPPEKLPVIHGTTFGYLDFIKPVI